MWYNNQKSFLKAGAIMGKFLVKQTKSGIKFDLKAANGETLQRRKFIPAKPRA